MTSKSLKTHILFLIVSIQLIIPHIHCDICTDYVYYECLSSGAVNISKADNVTNITITIGGESKRIEDTIPTNLTEYVWLLEGYLFKYVLSNQVCYIVCHTNSSWTEIKNPQSSYILPKHQNEVGDIVMSLREDNQETSQEISHAYIGDTIFMFLKYTGSADYFIQPLNCTAFSGNYIPDANHSFTFWNIASSGASKYFSNFTRVNGKTVSGKMYAFKFAGSDDVTFACNVKICMNTLSCQSIHNRKRKRRNDIDRHSAITMTISRKPLSSAGLSGAVRKKGSLIFTLILLIFWKIISKF